jgi:hypothetical protein
VKGWEQSIPFGPLERTILIHLGNQDIDRRIILKWMLEKFVVRVKDKVVPVLN